MATPQEQWENLVLGKPTTSPFTPTPSQTTPTQQPQSYAQSVWAFGGAPSPPQPAEYSAPPTTVPQSVLESGAGGWIIGEGQIWKLAGETPSAPAPTPKLTQSTNPFAPDYQTLTPQQQWQQRVEQANPVTIKDIGQEVVSLAMLSASTGKGPQLMAATQEEPLKRISDISRYTEKRAAGPTTYSDVMGTLSFIGPSLLAATGPVGLAVASSYTFGVGFSDLMGMAKKGQIGEEPLRLGIDLAVIGLSAAGLRMGWEAGIKPSLFAARSSLLAAQTEMKDFQWSLTEDIKGKLPEFHIRPYEKTWTLGETMIEKDISPMKSLVHEPSDFYSGKWMSSGRQGIITIKEPEIINVKYGWFGTEKGSEVLKYPTTKTYQFKYAADLFPAEKMDINFARMYTKTVDMTLTAGQFEKPDVRIARVMAFDKYTFDLSGRGNIISGGGTPPTTPSEPIFKTFSDISPKTGGGGIPTMSGKSQLLLVKPEVKTVIDTGLDIITPTTRTTQASLFLPPMLIGRSDFYKRDTGLFLSPFKSPTSEKQSQWNPSRELSLTPERTTERPAERQLSRESSLVFSSHPSASLSAILSVSALSQASMQSSMSFTSPKQIMKQTFQRATGGKGFESHGFPFIAGGGKGWQYGERTHKMPNLVKALGFGKKHFKGLW